MKQRLIEILEELRGAIIQQQLNISDDNLFSEACSFLRGEFANERFNSHVSAGVINPKGGDGKPTSANPNPPPEPLATDRQLAYAQKLADRQGKKIEINKGMTQKQASKLIEELKANEQRRDT